MTEDRFIILTVAYQPYTGRGPSLDCIAPELKDAGLSLIDDNHHGWNASRRWAGLVDGPTFNRFADAWQLHKQNDDRASDNPDDRPAMHVHTIDGTQGETQGLSAIVFATVQVWVVGLRNRQEAQTRSPHPVPFAHVA